MEVPLRNQLQPRKFGGVLWYCMIIYALKTLLLQFGEDMIPTAPSLFRIPKLNLQRNNVRAVSKGGIPQWTPKYNSSILEDMFIEDTEQLVKQTFLGSKELREGLVLLKVWARRRIPIYAYDCLNGFLISVILAYLVDRNHINKSMKAMQIFRVTMKFIATLDLWKHGLYFTPKGRKAISKEVSCYWIFMSSILAFTGFLVFLFI